MADAGRKDPDPDLACTRLGQLDRLDGGRTPAPAQDRGRDCGHDTTAITGATSINAVWGKRRPIGP